MYLYRYVFKPDNTYPMSVYITILAVWWTIWYQQLKHFFTDHFNCQINLSQGKCFCIRFLFFLYLCLLCLMQTWRRHIEVPIFPRSKLRSFWTFSNDLIYWGPYNQL